MSSNDRYTVSCTAQMLPAMLHALSLARATAMCCSSPKVQKEFGAMLEALAAQAGIPKLLESVDEYKWYAACEALKVAKEYHWYTKEGSRRVWDDPESKAPGETSLVVDGREFPLNHGFMDDNPHLQEIKDLVEMYASVHAVKGEPESGWRSYRDLAESRKPKPEPKPEPATEPVRAVAPTPYFGEDTEDFDPDEDDEEADYYSEHEGRFRP